MTQPSDLYPQPLLVGLLAQRPTFVSQAGQFFYATDAGSPPGTLYECTVAGTSATWVAVGGPGGSGGTPGGSNTQVQFNDSSAFGGATNFLYTKATGVITANQKADTNETIYGKRFTDTTPTGNLLHFQNAAANVDLFLLNASGALTIRDTLTITPVNFGTSFISAPGGDIALVAATGHVVAFGGNETLQVAVNTGLISQYGTIPTVSNGVPSELATVDLNGQTAAKTTTTLYTPAATGLFRISAYAKVTTASAGGTSALGGVAGLTLGFTDGTDSVAQTLVMDMANEAGASVIVNAGNATSTKLIGSSVIFAKTGVAITYAFDYATTVGTMAYELHMKLEAL